MGFNKVIGGKSDRDTPGSMPNPAVKPVSVDGTVWGTHGRADRRQFRFEKREVAICGFPFLLCLHYYSCKLIKAKPRDC